MKKNIVGFIFGGNSAENEVSVVTTLGIDKIMKGVSNFSPEYIYMSKENKFFYIKRSEMNVDTFKSGDYLKKENEILILHGGDVIFKNHKIKKKLFHLSACVNCCHGGAGEDGNLSGYFNILSIPFSTSSHTALGIAMDKNLFKLAVKSMGILSANWVHFSRYDWQNFKSEIIHKISQLKFPLIVKPNASGSSLGINIARNLDELNSMIDIAFEFDNSVIVEKLIENKTEFNCAVIGNENEIIVSDVDQIEEKGDMFSFQDKYIGNCNDKPVKNVNSSSKKLGGGMESVKRLLPAPISNNLKDKIQETSAKIFKTLGLSGVVRIDFLYDNSKKKLYVGEVNAVPGSLALYFFKNSKIGVLGVINKLINIAKNSSENNVSVNEKFIPKIFRN